MNKPSTPVNSVLGLIGGTPIVRLTRIPDEGGAEIYAKLECMNPGGSIKDRIAAGMIDEAEGKGLLAPNGTIIEPTAGNTGIGLALVGVQRGYRVILVVPEQFSVEKRELMRALGGEVVLTAEDAGMKGAIEKAHELAAEIEGGYVPQQFANPGNSRVHYETTGPEIWEQMEGRVDGFVAGSGTGGTFTGVTRFLKEKNPNLLATVVEPQGSILQGGEPGPHEVEGIGSSFIPDVLDLDLADEIVMVEDPSAFEMVGRLAHDEGLLVGSSSGAAVVAASGLARKLGPGKRVVTIVPDSSERYLSKGVYSRWRERRVD